MSFLASFFEGAAGSAANYFNKEADAYRNSEAEREKSAREEERAIRMAEIKNELDIQKEKAIQEYKRSMNIQAGQDISAEADRIGTKRALDKTNPVEDQSNWTPEQEAVRSKAQPSLLSSMTRSERLRDMADGAMKTGNVTEGNALRTQLNTELTGERQEKANEVAAKNLDIKDRELARKSEADKSDREMAEKRLLALIDKQSGANKEEKVLGIVDSQRKDLTAQTHSLDTRVNRALDELAKDHREALKDITLSEIDKKNLQSDYLKQKETIESRFQPEREELATKRKASDALYEIALERAGVKVEKTPEPQKTYGGYPVQTSKTQEDKSRKTPPDSKKQGQIEILQQEVKKAQAIADDPKSSPEDVRRANQDLESISREFKNLGVSADSSRMNQFKVLR